MWRKTKCNLKFYFSSGSRATKAQLNALFNAIFEYPELEGSRLADSSTFEDTWRPLAIFLNKIPGGRSQDANGWKAVRQLSATWQKNVLNC